MISRNEAERYLGPVEVDQFYRAMDQYLKTTSRNQDTPGYGFFLGWIANNEARIPRDAGDLADSRILDFVHELMGIVRTSRFDAALFQKLEEKLTPLLSIAYAELDKANGKDPSWELIPRRQHSIYYTYDFMRGRL